MAHITINELKDRIIILGDIHGCYDEFMDLLEKCSYNKDNDILILVGDLVLKGPKSAEVVRYANKNNILSIKGNVDERALSQYDALKNSTNSWGECEWFKSLNDNDIAYLRNMPYSISVPEYNIIIVHAGMVPNIPLEKQKPHDLLHMRNIIDHGTHLEGFRGEEKGSQWIRFWHGPEHIYFGHDAKRGLQQTMHATGLDSGCCYGGKLTACILTATGRDFVQVNAKCQYYAFPVFKG